MKNSQTLVLAMLLLCPFRGTAATPAAPEVDLIDRQFLSLIAKANIAAPVKKQLTEGVVRAAHFARALVAHDHELICVYVRKFPRVVPSDVAKDYMTLSVNREFFRHGATNSLTINKALNRYEFPEVFGPIPALALIKVVKGKIPEPSHFTFSYLNGVAKVTAKIKVSSINLGVVKALRKQALSAYYTSSLAKAGSRYNDLGDYDFALQLFVEAQKHGDQGFAVWLGLLKSYLGLNETKKSAAAYRVISTHFLSRIDRATTQDLIFLAALNCNYEQVTVWEMHLQKTNLQPYPTNHEK